MEPKIGTAVESFAAALRSSGELQKETPTITYKYYDTNMNGRDDACLCTSSTGRVEFWYDKDHDGDWDVVLIDNDGDGTCDEGKLDDSNPPDGKFDSKWVDANGDGIPTPNEITDIESPEDVGGPPLPQ